MKRRVASAWIMVLVVVAAGCSREDSGAPKQGVGPTPAPVEIGNPDLARLEQQERRIRELELQLKEQEAARNKAEARAGIPAVRERLETPAERATKATAPAEGDSGSGAREERSADEPEPLPVVSPIPTPPSESPSDDTPEEPVEEAPPEVGGPPPDEGEQVQQQPSQIVADPNAPFALTQLVIAEGVDRSSREPQGAATEFSSDLEKLYVYLVFRNHTDQERTVTIHWNQNGKERSRIDLRVGAEAKRWRTWGYQNLRRPSAGDWDVVVADEDGVILGTQNFVVRASPREVLP